MTPEPRIQAAPIETPQTVAFLIVPQFAMLAFVSAVEPLRVANRLAGRELYRWVVVSRDGKSVTASNGMSLLADYSLDSKLDLALAVVCAGFEPERYFDRATRKWLSGLNSRSVDLGAIDTGSFFLAWAGLLDGYRATTHWEGLDSFREAFPKVEADGGLFVIDRNRLTCAGGTAALDMMLHLISLQHGHRLAAAASEQFIHARIRPPNDRQRMEPPARQGVTHPGLAQALSLMEQNLEDPLDAAALAKRAGLSLRQLERLFHRHFSMTPHRYYLTCACSARGRCCNTATLRWWRSRSPAASPRRPISRGRTARGRARRRPRSAAAPRAASCRRCVRSGQSKAMSESVNPLSPVHSTFLQLGERSHP
jgi:transcriptional regulator GlxA family with amidase domain